MIAFISKLFGVSIPPWVIEVVAALAIAGAATLYLEHRGAAGELAKLQKSSTVLVAKANAEIKAITTAHTAEIATNKGELDAARTANATLSDKLDQRVRDFDAYRRAHPDVASAAGGRGPADSGECGTQSCGDLAVLLAKAGDELARSNGELAAALQSCQRERDSLTGLPPSQ